MIVDLLPNFRYSSQDTLVSDDVDVNGFNTPEMAMIWRDRSCGIACVRMILQSLGLSAPSLARLVKDGTSKGRYIDNVGWSHSGLAEFLEEAGLTAHAKQFSSLRALDQALKAPSVVILSVRPAFEDQSNAPIFARKGGHLVLCHGYEIATSNAIVAYRISDPDYATAQLDRAALMPTTTLEACWAYCGIVCSVKYSETNCVWSPTSLNDE